MKSSRAASASAPLRAVRAAARKMLGRSAFSLLRGEPSVFVLSTGRTGTQTLAALLALSPEIEAHHEPEPQLLLERREARTEVYAQKRKYRRIFAGARGYPLLRAKFQRSVYAETSPRLTFFAPVIAELLPQARFLYVHRDPSSVVRSAMRRGWYAGHPLDYARIAPVVGERYYDTWRTWGAFKKNCWYWNAYNDFSLNFSQSIEPNRVLVLPARKIFDGTLVPKLFEFLGVEEVSNEAVSSVLEMRLNAQTTSEYPQAYDWSRAQWNILESLAGDTMAELGYKSR